ncbi:MAG: IS66 family transposase, partial [Solirubrobacterales bacterium]
MTELPPPAAGCAACSARDAVIAEQARVLGEQARAIEELRAGVAGLRSEVADLRRRLGRNSRNSSMPPSADDLPGRAAPKKEQRGKGSGRGRGKQPGTAGTSMAWARPDEVIDHRPAGVCGCGADLAGAADLGVARSFQQLEIPLITARRIQHDLYQARCGCGEVHVAARPAGVPDPAVSIGPDVRALAVYLVVFQHVPIGRCVQLIADVTGAAVSAGFVHSCLAKAAEVIADVVKLIKTLITAAAVAGFDETTLRCGPAGQKRYVLAAVTELYSVFFPGRRTLESFRDFGILPGFAGVVVSDRYVNYFHAGWEHITGNQACLAHLIRDYQDAAESYPHAIWPVQAQRALRGLIRAWHAARDAGQPAIPPGIRDPLLHEFRHAVLAGCSDVPRIPGPKSSTAQHPGRDLLEFCRDRHADVTRFCGDTRIWPTNNISERGVRPVKTQQKISGRLTSEDATQDRLDIRSYIDT